MKLISNMNSDEIILILNKDDLTPYICGDTARSRMSKLASTIHSVLCEYYTDGRRANASCEEVKLYLDLFEKISTKAQHLHHCEIRNNDFITEPEPMKEKV